MTDSLFFLANKTTLEYNYLKVKNSRELIEISHPNKVDVIDSMKQTESDLENSTRRNEYIGSRLCCYEKRKYFFK